MADTMYTWASSEWYDDDLDDGWGWDMNSDSDDD